jgi:hypothetical protein
VTTSGTPVVEKPVPIPMFDNHSLIGVEIFERSADIIASALDVAPNAAEMQQKVRPVAAHVRSSPTARAAVDTLLREKVIPEFKVYATTKVGPMRNQWLVPATAGNYGRNYRARTMVNLIGIWGNNTQEVIYLGATQDRDCQPLDGGKSYVIHFPADGLPDSVVDACWSVILVSIPDYRVVANPLKRYNLNNHSPWPGVAPMASRTAIS